MDLIVQGKDKKRNEGNLPNVNINAWMSNGIFKMTIPRNIYK